MAIENTYLLGKNITLGCGFDLQAKAPLDSRQVVPAYAGLQALIDENAAYEGMIVYDEETKKTYQAQIVNDVLTFREFGINEDELKNLIAAETTAAMEFKGATASLPESGNKGDMYKVSSEFEVAAANDEEGQGFTAKVGDSIVYANTTYAEDGETVIGCTWYLVPSGDDIEDTWRPVTNVDSTATLTFEAGANLEKTVAANGTITYKHSEIAAPTNRNAEGDEQTRTYITQLITDNHGHIIGFKTATENVEDTNTTYTFEGQSDEATSVYFQVTSNEENATAEAIYLDTYSKNEIATLLSNLKNEIEIPNLVIRDTTDAEIPDTNTAKVLNAITEGTEHSIDSTAIEVVTKAAWDKVTEDNGIRLINDIEIKKLAALDLNDNELTMSGSVNAAQVKELDERIVDIVTGIGSFTITEASGTEGTDDYTPAVLGEKLGIEKGAEVNVLEGIRLGSADSGVLAILEDKTTVIPIASGTALGVVKSSEAENKVSVSADGTMEVKTLNANRLVQTAGEWLILDGGNAGLSETAASETEQ